MPHGHDKVTDLYAKRLDVTRFKEVEDTNLAFAPIDGAEDAYAIRDLSNVDAGTIRTTAAALRKLGIAL